MLAAYRSLKEKAYSVYDLGFDMSASIIRTVGLRRTYVRGGHEVRAVQDITVEIEQGEFVSIMGPSGSGKSTLMGLLGLLDTPTSGQYFLDGLDVSSLRSDARAAIRNQKIGFIFQNFRLLARSTALENVELPLQYAGLNGPKRRRRATAALELVGLGDRLCHWPNQMSGGEQQRVAIARGLVNNPKLILADEPTGALDRKNAEDLLVRLKNLRSEGRTLILVTHDAALADHADRIIKIQDGLINRQENSKSSKTIRNYLLSPRFMERE